MTPELLALLAVVVAGAAVTLAIDHGARGSLLAGEALLFGVGAGAAVLLALSLAHFPWSRVAWGGGMAAITVVALVLVLCRTGTLACPPRYGSEGQARVPVLHVHLLFLALAVVLVLGYFLLATLAPIWEFDFIADWGFKARAFFVARGVDWTFLEHPLHRDIHPDYPLLLTLSFDVLAVARGAWNDQTLGVMSVVFGVALLLVLHGMALEDSGSRPFAAFVTAAMVPLACSPWIGLAEGPLVAYGTAALLLIRRGRLGPGSVMLGLAASTKNEGLTLIVAAAAGLVFARRWRELPRLWPAVAIPLPWLVLRRMHHLQTDLTEGNFLSRILQHLASPKPLLDAFATYSVGKPWFWIALGLGVLLTIWKLAARERFVLVAVCVQFAFYVGAYLATPHDVFWHVRWSWERLMSHLAPVLTYLVLVYLAGGRTGTGGVDSSPQLY